MFLCHDGRKRASPHGNLFRGDFAPMSPVPGSARDLHHEDYDSLGCTGSLLCLGEEEVSSWRYVGEGKGHYMIVNDYKSVGEKKGSYSPRFERTYTRFRPRLSVVSACFILVALTILGAVAVAQAHSRLADGRSALRHAKHPGALGAYNCQADGSTLPMIKTLIHAAQRCEHADQDGNILMSNLNSCQELPPTILGRLEDGDLNGDGMLDGQEFQDALRSGRMDISDVIFNTVDTDGDQRVNEAELQRAREQRAVPDALADALWASDHNSDGVIGKNEFKSVSQPFMQGPAVDLAKAAWAILDGNGDGIVSKNRLQSTAVWANLPSDAFLRLLPPGESSLSEQEFFTATASIPATAWTERQRQWCCANQGVCVTTVTSSTTLPPFRNIKPLHNCHAGYDDWWHNWDFDKQTWCCSHFARGCPSWTLPPSKTAETFDCDSGYAHWKSGWSPPKKLWCCRHQQRGCAVYDCHHREETWMIDWTPGKKDWCCQHSGLGCSSQAAAAAAAAARAATFDCHAGLQHWRSLWSSPKKAWCCDHYHVACHPEASHEVAPSRRKTKAAQAFDCRAGADKWREAWSHQQQAWCCAHEQMGCAESSHATSANPFDCSADIDSDKWTDHQKAWCCDHYHIACEATHSHSVRSHAKSAHAFDCSADVDKWTDHQKAWCCDHYQIGCEAKREVHATLGSQKKEDSFDCSAGVKKWREGWSSSKKAWCCDKYHIACEATHGHHAQSAVGTHAKSGNPFDCSLEHVSWSPRKKAWCCIHQKIGCPDKEDDYDCSIGLANWESHWSSGKKKWCCHHYDRGCDYDCSALLHRDSWSEDQKAWCCRHKGKGCPGSPLPRFDCSDGLHEEWAGDKKDWCCKQEQVGCASHESYDCSHGYSNWRHAWSDDKTDWCCRHKNRGCEHDCREDMLHWKTHWSSSRKKWCCDHVGFGCER